jgi:hypothetical protein
MLSLYLPKFLFLEALDLISKLVDPETLNLIEICPDLYLLHLQRYLL